MVVFDAASSVGLFLNIFLSIYGLTILVYILLSWFRLPYAFQPVQHAGGRQHVVRQAAE